MNTPLNDVAKPPKSGTTIFHKVEVLLTTEQLEHVKNLGKGSANAYIRELIDDDISILKRNSSTRSKP